MNDIVVLYISEKHRSVNQCTICKEKFKYKSTLAKHTYDVHKGTKPFQCELCEYGCFKNTDLTKHIQAVHEGKKPFVCELCRFATTGKGNLNRHIEAIHEGKKPHSSKFIFNIFYFVSFFPICVKEKEKKLEPKTNDFISYFLQNNFKKPEQCPLKKHFITLEHGHE